MKYEIFSEKYRPNTLSDVAGQPDIVKRLKVYVEQKNFPNLMFAGPPGTGKTSAAIVIAKEIFGDTWVNNFLEINSSDERGIDVIRGLIKKYANTKPVGDVPFKILSLDECENITSDGQAALRRTMERYTTSCRFILSCNYSSKVIEPIQSRCAVFRFRGISPEAMKERLNYIASQEDLFIDEVSHNAIFYISEGDMRKAVNCLETASLMGKNITVENIYKSNALAHPQEIREFIDSILSGNFINALDKLDILMIIEGLSAEDILNQLYKEVLIYKIQDRTKVDFIDVIGETDFHISEGSNPRIQMRWLIARMIKIYIEIKKTEIKK